MALGLSCRSGGDGHNRGDHVGMVQAQTISLAQYKDCEMEGLSPVIHIIKRIAFRIYLEGESWILVGFL